MKKEEFKGLNNLEARKKLGEHGLNEIKDIGKKSLIKILLGQIKSNFIVYLLFFAMILSFFVGKEVTGYVILIVIITVIFTGFFQEYKAEKAIENLNKMVTPVSIVIREGKEKEIPTKEIVPGDILVLRAGEKIPADCMILSDKDLLVNEAILTGESQDVRKTSIKNINDKKDENLIFTGSFITSGKCVAKVLHTGMNTRFGKIAGMISLSEKELPLQDKVNKIAKYMAIGGLFFSILTGLIMLLRTPGIDNQLVIETLMIVIAVAVSSFPEGFPVVLITSLAKGTYRMAEKNAIVNRMSIIETLGETTVICSDKTGTITKGEMTVKKIYSDHNLIEVTGAGYSGKGDFVYRGNKINPKKDETLRTLLKTAVFCNDAQIEEIDKNKNFEIRGNPTEASLLTLSAKSEIFKEDLRGQRIDEKPFTSDRKLMSVVYTRNRKKFVYAKGALEMILDRCTHIKRHNGIFKLLERDKKKILQENQKMTSNALRTLAFAYKELESKEEIEKNLIFLGLVGIEDPPREDVKQALDTCKKAGIKIKMITGDNKETALSIAKQIGLDPGNVLLGKEIDEKTDEELKNIVKNVVIFARVNPEHKLRIVKALKENGEIVTMTGDGVNDAPALKEAHIGVAMGKNGTDVSRSVADLTLRDDNFATIVDAVREGRTIFTNIQKFTTYQISVNVSQVGLIFLAILLGLPLPLIALQILFMNLFSDELTALTLAFNPYSKDVMKVKPRKKSSIITKPLFLMLVISGIIMAVFSLGVFHYVLTHKSEIAARTVVFITMIFFGIANAFNFRSFRKPVLTRSPFVNMKLIYASLIALGGTLMIVYIPFFNTIFETTPISWIYWLGAFLVSLSVIIVFDLIKYLNEKKEFWTEDLQDFVKKK